ncbi:MAG: hypothetical protein N3B21_06540 [Clostridia bacterium]|nr:hypothetical protein [Clostridia bacterium]
MDEQMVVNKINGVFEESGYPLEISDISDIEDFLNNQKNMDLEVYEVVEQLYSQLMEDYDTLQ